jgi:predicted ATP-binding protein involved in virulence
LLIIESKMENKKGVATENKDHSYFYSLELEGVNCFKDKQTLDLSDGNGNYSPWTIILGDNGTGKTTLLRVLDRMQPIYNPDVKKYLPYLLYYGQLLKNDFLYVNLSLVNKEIKKFMYKKLAANKAEGGDINGESNNNFPFLISYGASRRMSKKDNLISKEEDNLKMTSLFDESIELINAEEWYLQKFLAFSTSKNGIKVKLEQQLSLIKKVLVDFLPDVLDLEIKEIKNVNDKSSLEVKINEKEWINLRDLSFGYQTLTALIVDIASKMMEKYTDSETPLSEPVIILIDEIDLHLHPKWQRTVINKLSEHFPKAQFIATSHSPLIVQAAQDKNANIVVCRKEDDKVIIDNTPDEVKGWRIDQILISDLFEINSPRSIETENFIKEKNTILSQSELLESDKQRLKELNTKIKSVPFSLDKEGINAEDIIKKAAELLNK